LEYNIEQESYSESSYKTHEEILELIEEIKGFESLFSDFEIIEEIDQHEDLIEFEYETSEDISTLPSFIPVEEKPEFIELETIEPETIEPEIKTKRKKHPMLRIKFRTNSEVKKAQKEERNPTPTIFKMRFNDEGQFINTDLKKTKPKKKKQGTKHFSIKRIRKQKKTKLEQTSSEETEEKESKGSRFKRRLGKLKRVIPSRDKKKESKEESEFEE